MAVDNVLATMSNSSPGTGRQRILPGAAGLVWLALAAAAVIRFRGWALDDFYITYRYAENLARGHGFVFNLGERVFGVSDPGLGLTLALLHAVTRAPIEWIASVLFGAVMVAIPVLLLREGAACGRRVETLLGGSLVLVSSFLWVNQGAAAPVTLLALLGAATLADSRPWMAGVLAGLAVWVRPDAGVGVVILLLLLWFDTGRIPWKTGLASAAVIVLGLLCAWLWFGSILPGTLEAKVEASQAMLRPATGAEGFWRRGTILFRRHFGPWWLLFIGLGVAGLGPLARSMGRLGRLTAFFGCALAVLYPVLGAPYASWYAVIPVIVLFYGVPFCVLGLARGITAPRAAPRRWTAALGVAGLAAGTALVVFLAGDALRVSFRSYAGFAPPARLAVYQRAAEWLRRNSRPEDAVAYVEIGVLGYYSRRQLEDQMGLVTPRVVPYLDQGDLAGGFLTKPTEYVIHHTRAGMAPIVQASWFPAAYEQAARFRERGSGGGRLVIFRRRPGAVLPPPPALGQGVYDPGARTGRHGTDRLRHPLRDSPSGGRLSPRDRGGERSGDVRPQVPGSGAGSAGAGGRAHRRRDRPRPRAQDPGPGADGGGRGAGTQ